MITPTIAEIRRTTYVASPRFFDRATLRFFGQTMRAFKVRRSPSGRVFIFAPRYSTDYGQPRLMGYTFREYVRYQDNKSNVPWYAMYDLITPRNDDGTLAANDTLAEVLNYIGEH